MEHGQAPGRILAPFWAAGDSRAGLVHLAHLLPVLWLFGGALFGDRVLYFRDLSSQYAPDYAFLHASLSQGVWPLWNPLVDGGGPCLFVYPLDLILVWLLGPKAPLGPGTALHLYLALCGGSALARRMEQGNLGAWVAGTVYGLSGCLLSLVNLLQLFHAAAWAPWVVAAFLDLVDAPGRRRAARLALLAALQASTLGAEIAIQTLVIALVLGWRRASQTGPAVRWIAVAAVGTLLISAPALAGAAWLVEGSARSRGFAPELATAFSAHPVVLWESVVPRLFGNVHAFSDVGFWGQPFFPEGFPYLLSLYLGPIVLAIALTTPVKRLLLLFVLGAAASLGKYGPFGGALAASLPFLRGPVKFFFMATLAAALLAGMGLERALRGEAERRRTMVVLVASGSLLAVAGFFVGRSPGLVAEALGGLVPALRNANALLVAGSTWPLDWLASGGACLAAGLTLALPRAVRPFSAAFLAADLLAVNGALNPLADPSFYALQPAMAEAVTDARREGRYRWFSYGVSASPGLRWNPAVARAGSDAWLYYVDRQALVPRSHALDGLEGIFDMDRTGWAPPGSTLHLAEASPGAFREIAPRLRDANVGWILSFQPLPEDLVVLWRKVPLPQTLDPVLVYELRDRRPRAFRVAGSSPSLPPAGSPTYPVAYSWADPHTVRVEADVAEGSVVVLDYCHPDWRLETSGPPIRLERVEGRYCGWSLATGGTRVALRFSPRWPAVALSAAVIGLLGVLWLLTPLGKLDTAEPAR